MDKGFEMYRRYLDGDDAGIEEIVEEYKDGLILYINGFVKNIYTAEDLAEDTFFRIMVRRPLFKSLTGSFKTWLFTIGRNIALDYLRKQRETQFNIDETQIADSKSLADSYYQKQDAEILKKALSQLNKDYEQVLYLSYFEDFKNEEIAKIMHKTKRQIETMLYRGKAALKQKLLEMGYEYENK